MHLLAIGRKRGEGAPSLIIERVEMVHRDGATELVITDVTDFIKD